MTESKAEAVTADLKALAADSRDLGREVQAQALQKSGDLGRKYKELFDSALAAAKEAPSAAAAKTKEVAASTDDYVHQNPWRAVTISAGIGLLFGFLFSRK